jgi:glycosyltransferase involved in cell wall biosynthesis
LKLGAGDIVFVPGGFGFSTQILKFYRKLAARHVQLVFLIHDVFPITQPDLTAPGSAAFFAPAFALPDEIITTTRFNAADFLRAHEIATKTVCKSVPHVIPLAHEFPGAQRNLKPGEASRRLSDALQGKPFVVSIGTIEIRKNHAVLMQAWRALQQELGEKLPLLVIAGRRGWQAQDALDLLDHAQETTAPYVFIEGPTDEELKWLYASCEFSVLPSLFEGWGLPVGESLWFGKACAASKTSSIPEVGGDLCFYFDPNDPDDMKAAIKRLLDPVTRKAFEDKIRAADLRQWSDVARDLIAVLFKMAEAP